LKSIDELSCLRFLAFQELAFVPLKKIKNIKVSFEISASFFSPSVTLRRLLITERIKINLMNEKEGKQLFYTKIVFT
jgi:hypothetical protein